MKNTQFAMVDEERSQKIGEKNETISIIQVQECYNTSDILCMTQPNHHGSQDNVH